MVLETRWGNPMVTVMARPFALIIDGEIQEFDRYEDLPEQFDRVVRFIPPAPPPPHTPEQHDELALWTGRLQALMAHERAGRRPPLRGPAPVT